MKNKYMAMLSFCLAFLLFVFPFSYCFDNETYVSASGNSSTVLSFTGQSSISSSDLNDLYSNPTFVQGCLFVRYTGFSTYSGICNLSEYYHESSGGWDYYCNYNPSGVRLSSYNEFSSSSTSDINFSSISNNVTEAMIIGFSSSDFIICYTDSSFLASNSLSALCQTSSPNNNDYWHVLPPKRPTLQYAVVFPVTHSSFNPSDVHSFTGLNLDFNETDFYNWLVDNDKVEISVSSGGSSVSGKIPAYIGLQKLKSFISFYKQYGGSNTSFFKFIKGWFSYMNIASQTGDNINVLKNTIDNLYREYLNSYIVNSYSNTLNHAHQRKNIQTNTDDNNTALITDDSSDTVDTSILRDILRGIISLSSSITSHFEALFDKLDDLNFTVNVSNNGGSGITDFSDLYIYDVDAFNNDLADFQADIEEVQNVPQGYIDVINQNSLMPENMLEDKNSLTVNVPTITGFTVGGNGSTYSTQTGSYVLRSADYPWLDTVVQKIKRFASILLILGYLVHLRYRIPELIRGE